MSISSIKSAISTRLTTGKPYFIGGAIGAVATLLVQFNAGWVVAAGTHNEALAEARVNAMAAVCAHQAGTQWVSEGKEMSALGGWTNEDRDVLVQRFTPQMKDVRTEEITRLCSRMLRQA